MQIKRFNISKPRKYTGKDGQEKTQWNNIGTITEFHKEDGKISTIIEIPAIGLEASIFPIEPKVEEPKQEEKVEEGAIEYPKEDSNPNDIPF